MSLKCGLDKQGNALCKDPSLRNILIAVDYCVHQLDQSSGCMEPGYFKREGVAIQPMVNKHSLQYDMMQIGTVGMRRQLTQGRQVGKHR